MTKKTTTYNRSRSHHSAKARDPCNPRNGDMHRLSVIEYYLVFILLFNQPNIILCFIFVDRPKDITNGSRLPYANATP